MEKINIYNSASKKLEHFVPYNPPQVGIYLCGPTVYGPAHFGHARSAITIDVMVRYLRHIGYNVCYVRNITDVGHLVNDADQGEDKIGQVAKKAQINPMEVAQQYTNSYRKDMAQLNLLSPSIEPQATGHITEQIALIETILAKGFAYEVNGSVYFDLSAYQKQHGYAVLSGRKAHDAMTGTRPLAETAEKRHPNDFALWKKASHNHLMQWPSPWGAGFPGWHIECTAMSQKYLGKTFDIYAGGLDLLFPHHDCGMAQAIAATGVAPARYWVHNNLVMIQQQKMSKSAGNFITLSQCFQGTHPLLTQAYTPMVLRFFMLQAHYRSPINFSNEALKAAQKGYYKLINALQIIENSVHKPDSAAIDHQTSQKIMDACTLCHQAMNQDFNTAQTIAQLFELRKWLYQIHHGQIVLAHISLPAWKLLKQTYTTFLHDILGLQEQHTISPKALINALLDIYADAKATKNYTKVQAIRDVFHQQRILVHDTNQGITWSYVA